MLDPRRYPRTADKRRRDHIVGVTVLVVAALAGLGCWALVLAVSVLVLRALGVEV